jgi:CcmD family protein
MTHLGYLFAAYTVVIGGIALYLRRMLVRLRAIDRELDDLRRRMGDSRRDR